MLQYLYTAVLVATLMSTISCGMAGIHFFRCLAELHKMRKPPTNFQKLDPKVEPRRLHFGLMLIIVGIFSGYAGLAIGPRMPFLLVVIITLLDAITVSAAIATYLLMFAPLLNKNFPKVWLKALDFIYLPLGFVGVARFINNPNIVLDPIGPFDFIALTAIVMSMGIKLAKSIIEVFFPRWC